MVTKKQKILQHVIDCAKELYWESVNDEPPASHDMLLRENTNFQVQDRGGRYLHIKIYEYELKSGPGEVWGATAEEKELMRFRRFDFTNSERAWGALTLFLSDGDYSEIDRQIHEKLERKARKRAQSPGAATP